MHSRIPSLLTALLLIALTLSIASAQDEPKPAPAATIEELDQRLAELFVKHKVPGATVAVIEDDAVVLAKAYGLAEVERQVPATPDTVFRAGSISKSLVGIAVMMLVEEGKLDLEAKLADLAPEIRFRNAWESTDPVRVAHLMEHTTGFDDLRFSQYLIDGSGMSLRQAIDLYGPYESRWRPGTWFAYCNAAPVIAGYLVEKASGLSWAEFTRTRIFEPLGMRSAHWDRAPAIINRLARSYQPDGVTPEPYVDIPGKPAGALNVTAGDLAKLARMLIGRGTVDGVTLLRPESVDRIETPHTTLASRNGLTVGYGLGNVLVARAKAAFHGHDGGIDGFLSTYLYQPEHRAGYVVMINSPQGEALAAGDAISDYLQRDWPATAQPEYPHEAGELEALTGLYQSVAPRQQMLAPLERLADWSPVKFSEGRFNINGTERKGVAPRVFRRAERIAPNVLFMDGDDGQMMLTPTGANRRVPLLETVLKATWGVLYALVLLTTLVYLPVWAVGWFRGRLRERGGVMVRLLPALAAFSIAAFAGTLLYALAGSPNTLQLLGTPSATARFLQYSSASIPVFGILAVLAGMRAPQITPGWVRVLAQLAGMLAFIAGAWLWPEGWVGLQTWL
jgi:CubicO group peptidase (beta-lactamase class C family)